MTEHLPTPPFRKGIPTVSRVLPDGSLVELLHDPDAELTSLAQYQGGAATIVEAITLPSGERLVPVSARNNLIHHGALLLPERPEPFASIEELLEDIETYLMRYVDLSADFLPIASAYVLLSWVYDAFNELPYLRFRGDYGSGKTRALIVLGSLCYKPFFASGASTVSPIFHTLDRFGATLIVDETDFRFSDEKAELVKIFNNGNIRGFPVLRTAITKTNEFDPRAFSVFGPKIVAMRSSFDDHALESRFLTEPMGRRTLRTDIPINLPDAQKEEARALRNQLLWYRFTTFRTMGISPDAYDPALSPRQNQIVAPLLSVVPERYLRTCIQRIVKASHAAIAADRAASPEGQLLEVLVERAKVKPVRILPIAAITEAFTERFGNEYDRPLTPRYVGHLLRNRLGFAPFKRHGSYVLQLPETEVLLALGARYGVGGQGDVGDVAAGVGDTPATEVEP